MDVAFVNIGIQYGMILAGDFPIQEDIFASAVWPLLKRNRVMLLALLRTSSTTVQFG